ncbi:metalloregulator ArsR/SmtB family transcription factor [Chryseolinea sp. T2]|uniref:ArsR/SmtB family transcription factor n=1 Tax=Chryseolinea sp. T2 TaxID=3129255 RepID=UPI0030783EBD
MKPRTQSIDPFSALADASRREVLRLLSHKTFTISDLAANFSISRPAVSKHIKLLEEAGFVKINEIGRERYCILSQDGFIAMQEWIDYFDSFWKLRKKKLESVIRARMTEHENS